MWCGNVVTSRQLPLLEPSAASKDDPRVIHDVLCIIWSFGDNRKLKLVQIFPNMTWHNTLRTPCHTMDVTHRDIRCQMSCGLLTDTFHDILHDMLSHWVTRLVRQNTINAGHFIWSSISSSHSACHCVTMCDVMNISFCYISPGDGISN